MKVISQRPIEGCRIDKTATPGSFREFSLDFNTLFSGLNYETAET